MRGFLESLRADLADRRVLPLVVLVAVALVAALGYAALAGGGGASGGSGSGSSGSGSSGSGSVSRPARGTNAGVVVTQLPLGANEAVAETTSGATRVARKVSNPFKPLTTPKAKSTASKSTSSSSGGSKSSSSSSTGGSAAGGSGSNSKSSSGSSGSSGSSSGQEHSQPTPAKPKQQTLTYTVSVEFGLAASGAQAAQLKSYENLQVSAALPSAKSPVVVFKGVAEAGKLAKFELDREILVNGPGKCLPSASQCLAIGLQVGQSEQLEYLPGNGAAVLYELKLTGISQAKGK